MTSNFEGLVLDGLNLNDATNFVSESLEIAPPSKRLLWLAGREGDILGDVPGYERRAVTIRVRVNGAASTDAALTALGQVTDKLQKAERTNGGISLVWTPADSTYSQTIKVLAGEVTGLPVSVTGDDSGWFTKHHVATLRLDCKPFLYGSETSYTTVTSSAPHVVAMARGVDGDVPAEGRLILTDMASQERDFAEYGLDPDPVTYEALALASDPSLFLRLSETNGLIDQSANAYTATAQGGVTIGGYSSSPLPLAGDDSHGTNFDGTDDYVTTSYPTRRNLVTNPRGVVDTAGWTSGAGAAIDVFAGVGAGVPSGLSNGFRKVGAASGDNARFDFAATNGVTYRASMYLKVNTLSATNVSATIRDSVGTVKATIATVTAAGGNFVRFNASFTADSTATWRIDIRQNGAGASSFDWTGTLVEVSSTLQNYFDGAGYVDATDTYVSANGTVVGWLGTAHASASDKGVFANGTTRTYVGVAARDNTAAIHVLVGGSVSSLATRLALASGSRDVLLVIGGTTYTFTTAWPNDTAFHCWALVFNEATDTASLYIDGVLFETKATVTAQHAANQSFQVAAHGAGTTPFDGKMGPVVVWESGLSADQIRQIYNAACSPYLIDSAHLLTTGLSGSGNTRTGAYNPTGAANSVIRGTTVTIWTGLAETGALPHVGPFRVKARVYTDGTDTQIRAAYRTGDAPFKRLNPVEISSAFTSQWAELDLGTIEIAAVDVGTQQATVRIEYTAPTTGKTLDLDYIELIPATLYGKARAPFADIPTPSAFAARDEFDQTAGVLAGKVLPIGGTWASAGFGADYSVNATSKQAERTAVSDASPHFALAGTTNYTTIVVRASFICSGNSSQNVGLLARYTSTTAYVIARLSFSYVGGPSFSVAIDGGVEIAGDASESAGIPFVASGVYSLTLMIDAAGAFIATVVGPGGTTKTLTGNDSRLATGGTRASGRVGLYDIQGQPTAVTRSVDDFTAWVPDTDAAIFTGKTLEFRHDNTLRQSSADATVYGRPSIVRGPGVFVPQAGSEGKVSRILAKATRNDIETGTRDSISDSTKLEISATPRSLVTPR